MNSIEIKCHFLPAKHHVGNGFLLYTMCFFVVNLFLQYSLSILRFVIQVSKRYSNYWFLAMCGPLGIVAEDYLDLEQLFGFSVGRKNIHASRETRRREQRASILSTFYNVSFVLMKSM